MFATANHTDSKRAANKTKRAESAPQKPAPEQNPVWQSLAVNTFAIQPKLAISQPNDPYEQEADRVADRVMRMAVPQPNESKLSISSNASLKGQRKCAACGEEEEQKLQRKGFDGHVNSSANAPPIVNEALVSGGGPLDSDIRAFMEPRFGQDFSGVRVHTDDRAAESARALNALAYTFSGHVVFGANQYAPHTPAGQRLLAHELTHVAQQSAAKRDGVVQRQQPGGAGPAPSPSPAPATVFHPGVNHGHTPSGRWADVQANPNSGFWENRTCANFPPAAVVGAARATQFSGKPLALAHLNWYISVGGGRDFVEDSHLDLMLRTDTGVQALLSGLIPTSAPAGGRFTGNTRVEQSDYQNQDFRYAFGAIDRLDFEVDFTAGTVHAWFQDRYEWHPVYPGLYTVLSGDIVRSTNCVHAAFVELQSHGASRDFWMKGEATVPLSLFRRATAGGGGGSTL